MTDLVRSDDPGPVVSGEVVDAAKGPRKAAPLPVLPAWLRNRHDLTSTAGRGAKSAAHKTVFHGVRLPLYWMQLAARSPTGFGRIAAGLYRWTVDADGKAVRNSAVDPALFMRLTEQQRSIVHGRLVLVGAGIGLAGVAVWIAFGAWGWITLVVLIPLLALLGVIGRTADHPILHHAPDTKLSERSILVALQSLGIPELNKAVKATGPEAVRFMGPIRQSGPGWLAQVELPPGVTAGQIAARRDSLASGLRRQTECVWPEGNPHGHAGQLRLWVGDDPLREQAQKPWPYLKGGAIDIFQPFIVGQDPRGRDQTVKLIFASMVIGAQPRMGKTEFLRLLLLAAGLDPTVELHIYDLKGLGDYRKLAPICKAYRAGTDPDDMLALLEDLEALVEDLNRRSKIIRDLPDDLCPENKVTRQLADRPDLGLHAVVVALDECQEAFTHKQYGERIAVLVEDLVRRGPAAGFITICATQRPDKVSLPTGISANAILRFCMRTADAAESNRVLGGNAAGQGYRADIFGREDLGIGYLAGEGDEPMITRAAHVTAAMAAEVVERALQARQAVRPEVAVSGAPRDLLDDLVAVWPEGREGAWWLMLLDSLTERWPLVYGSWEPKDLKAAVAPHRITDIQVKWAWAAEKFHKPPNQRGMSLEALRQAVAARPVPEKVNPYLDRQFDAVEAEKLIRGDDLQ